mgnify:CR=1 FL=1
MKNIILTNEEIIAIVKEAVKTGVKKIGFTNVYKHK